MKIHAVINTSFKISEEQKLQIKKICTDVDVLPSIILTGGITENEYLVLKKFIATCGTYEIKAERFYVDIDEFEEYEFFFCDGKLDSDDEIYLYENQYERNKSKSFDYTFFCPTCREGLRQIDSLKITGIKSRKKNYLDVEGYWIVSNKIKEKLIEENVTGIQYLNVLNSKGKPNDFYIQIKPSKILSSALVEGSYRILKSKNCGCKNYRVQIDGKYMKLKKQIKTSFEDFNELVETGEGSRGLYIISKKVLNILMDFDYLPGKEIVVLPVTFE